MHHRGADADQHGRQRPRTEALGGSEQAERDRLDEHAAGDQGLANLPIQSLPSQAVTDQQLPNGYYHLDRMLTCAARHGTEIGLCATCMDACGITDAMLSAEARRSSLDEVTDWTLWADETIAF